MSSSMMNLASASSAASYTRSNPNFIPSASTDPRPKALALTILVDWSNQDKADGTTTAGVKSSCHPCWLCVHFGPPPSALPHHQAQHAQAIGQWQLTLNIYSAERTPIVKKQNEEPIPKERRALLWFNTQPFDKYRYAVVMQHCRFPTALMPRVVAFHADRAEPDVNALVWVRKKTSQKRHKEDSYLKVVRGHIYHLHITFPDGSLVNQYIAQGWGFTASLFTYKRKRGHINVSPSRAVTQIRANWLDVVEADPDVDELEMARVAKLQDERDEQENLHNNNTPNNSPPTHSNSSSSSSTVPSRPASQAPAGTAPVGIQHPYGSVFDLKKQQAAAAAAAAASAVQNPPPAFGSVGGSVPQFVPHYSTGPIMSTTPLTPGSTGPANHYPPGTMPMPGTPNPWSTNPYPATPNTPITPSTPNSAPGSVSNNSSSSTKMRAEDWNQGHLDAFVYTTTSGLVMPSCEEMPAHYTPHVDLGPCVDSFFDAPSAPSAPPNATGPMTAPEQAPQSSGAAYVSASDREILSLFRALEQKAKSVATDSNSKLRDAAVRLTQVLSASGQLGGWQHVERFMMNPDMHARPSIAAIEARKKQAALLAEASKKAEAQGRPVVVNSASTTPGGAASAAAAAADASMDTDKQQQETKKGKIDELMEAGQDILRHAFIRSKWVLEIEKRNAGKQSDGKTLERVLGALLKDTKWMTDSANFLRSAEQQVSSLISMNPSVFAKFRELQSKGVQWPHSPHLRRQIERMGFVFRPMMIKRDRVVCDACGVEVSGIRPWHNMWLFHDWSKRHPFAPPAGTFSRPTAMDTQ